jgi:hypothetical protein
MSLYGYFWPVPLRRFCGHRAVPARADTLRIRSDRAPEAGAGARLGTAGPWAHGPPSSDATRQASGHWIRSGRHDGEPSGEQSASPGSPARPARRRPWCGWRPVPVKPTGRFGKVGPLPDHGAVSLPTLNRQRICWRVLPLGLAWSRRAIRVAHGRGGSHESLPATGAPGDFLSAAATDSSGMTRNGRRAGGSGGPRLGGQAQRCGGGAVPVAPAAPPLAGLLERHHAALARYCRWLVRDPDVAQDLGTTRPGHEPAFSGGGAALIDGLALASISP